MVDSEQIDSGTIDHVRQVLEKKYAYLLDNNELDIGQQIEKNFLVEVLLDLECLIKLGSV